MVYYVRLNPGTTIFYKIPEETHIADEDVELFRKEARIVASLVHPHIVCVFDFGVEGTIPFLVMDYAMGGTVRRRYPRGVALPLSDIVTYVTQTAETLQYAHDERVIHRDMKPENLLLGRRQEILLSDFGIAQLAQSSRSQSTQDVAGTATYMAPEQFRGKPRLASDQYALGVIVYEWLCGECPFQGSFTEIASQHLFVPPQPLREKDPSISVALEQIVMTALAKDPKQRFGSIQAFATAFVQASHASLVTHARDFPADVTPFNVPPFNRVVQPASIAESPSPITAQPAVEAAPPSQILLPPRSQAPRPQGMSRRAVITGLAGLSIGGAGAIWFATTHRNNLVPGSSSPARAIGTLLYKYTGHTIGVLSVKWSPDGRRIASGGSRGDVTIRVWDAPMAATLL